MEDKEFCEALKAQLKESQKANRDLSIRAFDAENELEEAREDVATVYADMNRIVPELEAKLAEVKAAQAKDGVDSEWMYNALMGIMDTDCTCHEESETGGIDGSCPSCKASFLVATYARKCKHKPKDGE